MSQVAPLAIDTGNAVEDPMTTPRGPSVNLTPGIWSLGIAPMTKGRRLYRSQSIWRSPVDVLVVSFCPLFQKISEKVQWSYAESMPFCQGGFSCEFIKDDNDENTNLRKTVHRRREETDARIW